MADSHWTYDDGGRESAGFKGKTGDCAVRAIAIATGTTYRTIYDRVNELAKEERVTKRRRKKSSARDGVWRKTMNKLMAELGWTWVACMTIGSGCRVHACADELPGGRLILRLSKHYTAMIDGVVHDIYDPTRGGKRCVYGYWHKEE